MQNQWFVLVGFWLVYTLYGQTALTLNAGVVANWKQLIKS